MLNIGLFIIEVTINLRLQPISEGVGHCNVLHAKGVVSLKSPLCTYVWCFQSLWAFVLLIWSCFNFSAHLSSVFFKFCSSWCSTDVVFQTIFDVVYFSSQASTLSCLSLSHELLHWFKTLWYRSTGGISLIVQYVLVATIVLYVANSFPFGVLLAIAHNCLSACSDCTNSNDCLFIISSSTYCPWKVRFPKLLIHNKYHNFFSFSGSWEVSVLLS